MPEKSLYKVQQKKAKNKDIVLNPEDDKYAKNAMRVTLMQDKSDLDTLAYLQRRWNWLVHSLQSI